jgi:bacillithiol synthase
MQVAKIPFDKVQALSNRDISYQMSVSQFEDYISYLPTIEAFGQAIEDRKKFPIDRSLLVDFLGTSYQNIGSPSQLTNISLLSEENTFTVVTAHQPVIFGGPAFYIYKVCSVINLCRRLKMTYPQHNFIPVFISGGEDHDFEEVKNINLFGKTITWNTDQTGSVGRFSLDGIQDALAQFKDIIGQQPNAQHIVRILEEALSKSASYSDFVFHWVNAFFADYGVIVMNMDDQKIKKHFAPIIKQEIIGRHSEELVKSTQDELNRRFQFKSQAFAREINFFYLSAGNRDRIIFEDGRYKVNHSAISFSEAELLDHIDVHPENFSPNVIMRPILQEYILPNLAYVGGGGELAYWLERKTQFAHYSVYFPMLVRRNSLMILSKSLQKSILKLNVSLDDLLMEQSELIRHYATRNAGDDADVSSERQEVTKIFDNLAAKIKKIDPTLEGLVLAEATKSIKSIEAIEGRLIKSLKAREEISIQQLTNLIGKLFPNGGLQERTDSFWTLYANETEDILASIIEISDPMTKEFLFVYT